MAAIRAATRAELGSRGYSGVTFEGVARRLGTSKPVLYRRYRNRAHLVADALAAELAPAVGALPRPGSGSAPSLRTDLLALLGRSLARREEIGPDTLRALLGDADADLRADLVDRSRRNLLTALRGVVDAAVARGDLGPGPIPDLVLLTPVTLSHAELTAAGRGSDPEFLARVVDEVAVPLFRAHAGPARPEAGRPAEQAPAALRSPGDRGAETR